MPTVYFRYAFSQWANTFQEILCFLDQKNCIGLFVSLCRHQNHRKLFLFSYHFRAVFSYSLADQSDACNHRRRMAVAGWRPAARMKCYQWLWINTCFESRTGTPSSFRRRRLVGGSLTCLYSFFTPYLGFQPFDSRHQSTVRKMVQGKEIHCE